MDIKGAEIFAAGTWSGSLGPMTFTEEDIDVIVAAFQALQQTGRVPLKFGHNEEQDIIDGQPAIGWVERVRREGSKLIADLTDIPRIVYDVIRKGLYKFVSIELLNDVETERGKFAHVLDAVALLGADIPAVGDLKDLQALTLSRTPGVRFCARVAFSRRDQLNGDRTVMGTENDEGREAIRTLTVEQVKLKADQERLEAEKAEFKRTQEAAASAEKRKTIDTHRNERKAQFDRAVKEGKITSAQRDTCEKTLRFSDDNAVLSVSAQEVDELITAMATRGRSTARSALTRSSGGGDGGGANDSLEAGDELAQKIAEEQAKFEEKGKIWGPEDAAHFARVNRQLVRSWMDGIGGGGR